MVGAGSGDHWPRQRPPPLCLPGRLAFFIGAFVFLGEWYIAILMGTLGFMFLPVAVGIALLKYGLYDIEVLINCTLVYGVLTAILAAVYFGGIVVLQRLFVALTATLRNETDLDALRDDLVHGQETLWAMDREAL